MRLDEYQIANALIDTRLVMTSRHGGSDAARADTIVVDCWRTRLIKSHRTAATASPASPPPSTTHAGLIFHLHSTASAATAIAYIGHPRKASPASLTVTPAISATAHTFTESRNAAIHGDRRSLGRIGPSAAT